MKQDLLQPPIKIWYKVLPGRGRVKWPIIDVRFTNKGNSLPQPLLALVDSGASESILHPLVAEALAFNLNKIGPPEKGGLSVSGKYDSWVLPSPIDIDIYGNKFHSRFTVINNKDLIWPCILGEDSIFEFARLDFRKFKGYFEVRFRLDIN